jgi:hypothetical protein
MGRQWCKKTLPIVAVNGKRVDISWESYNEINLEVTGPTQVEVKVPPGSTHEVLDESESFGGLGYTWQFLEDASCDVTSSGAKIRVRSFTPSNPDSMNAGEPFPIRLSADPLDSNNGTATVSGYANAWTPTASVRV